MLTVKLWNLNELAFEDLLLSINTKTRPGTKAFNLVDTCATSDQPDGNCKLAWDRLIAKYQPKTAPSSIQLKKGCCKQQTSRFRCATRRTDVWARKPTFWNEQGGHHWKIRRDKSGCYHPHPVKSSRGIQSGGKWAGKQIGDTSMLELVCSS